MKNIYIFKKLRIPKIENKKNHDKAEMLIVAEKKEKITDDNNNVLISY